MDPAKVYFLNEYYLIENLSLRLVEMDASLGYKLMLASEIKSLDDKTYLIKIKNSSFSNGDKITLNDVVASFKRAMGNKSSHIRFAELVETLEILDDSIKLTLKKRTNDFLYYLTLIDLSILHKTQIKDEIKVEDWRRATSGPFYYEVEDGRAYLKKNRHYSLTSQNYPDSIELLTAMSRNSFQDFKDGRVEIGEFNLNSYDKHISEISKQSNLKVIGNTGDMITFLALNPRSSKFKNENVRRWILKKIVTELKIDKKYSQVARKAYQFLTPQVKGFLDESKIVAEIDRWEIDLSKVPKEIEKGIVISTYKRAFEVTVESAVKEIERILKIPVTINTDVSSQDFERTMVEGKFEVFLGITSMDQVIVGESINLYYFSSFPMFTDVNGEIKKLMDQYKHSDSSKVQSVVNAISLQMIKDSECIPLFYVASPFFFNKDIVDVSALDELTYFNFWKIKKNQ